LKLFLPPKSAKRDGAYARDVVEIELGLSYTDPITSSQSCFADRLAEVLIRLWLMRAFLGASHISGIVSNLFY
jgi:hypothetical protein